MHLRRLPHFLVLQLVGLSHASPLSGRQSTSSVTLDYATYEGKAGSNGITNYLSMRYASAPVGDLRWKAPEDPPVETDVQSATTYRPVCIGVDQSVGPGVGILGGNVVDEDCLHISVSTPSSATQGSNLPVLLYIAGGGYKTLPTTNFDFAEFINNSGGSVMVVQISYRVGALGFLAGSKVKKGGDLNVGLLDQRKALQWVNKYIYKFGGDPNHVVLFGASAGAGSVGLQLTAYGGRDDGLFAAAIGDAIFYPNVNNETYQETQFDQFSTALGCHNSPDQLACLRSQDINDIQKANVQMPYPGKETDANFIWTPVVDGSFIPDFPLRLYQDGKFVKVPLIVGDVTNEGSLFVKDPTSSTEVSEFLSANYPGLTDSDLNKVNDLYPPQSTLGLHSQYFSSVANAYGEATFICPGIEIAKSAAQTSSSTVWNYRFNQGTLLTDVLGIGVWHNLDIGAIFGPNVGPYTGLLDVANTLANGLSYASYSTENRAVVPLMMNYILSFTRSLDPNTSKDPQAPEWKPFGSSSSPQRVVIQNNGSEMETIPDDQLSRCAFWESAVPRTGQ